jgi:hypothetical protein
LYFCFHVYEGFKACLNMINLDYDVLYAFLGSFVFYLMLIWKGLLFLDPGLIVPCILWEEKERIYIYIYIYI